MGLEPQPLREGPPATDAASVGGGLWLSHLFVLSHLAVAATPRQ